MTRCSYSTKAPQSKYAAFPDQQLQGPLLLLLFLLILLPRLLRGAKELGVVYINIIRGAQEPRNLQKP